MENLKKAHPRLFQCLQVEVADAPNWSKSDVELNKGIRVQNHEKMMDLESKLALRRTFRVSRLPLG